MVANQAVALFMNPPPRVAAEPVAAFWLPPAMVAASPLAVLKYPPPTVATEPAVWNTPPPTVPMWAVTVLIAPSFPPPAITAPYTPVVTTFPA